MCLVIFEFVELVRSYNSHRRRLSKMLVLVPEDRITAAQALQHPYFADLEGMIVDPSDLD